MSSNFILIAATTCVNRNHGTSGQYQNTTSFTIEYTLLLYYCVITLNRKSLWTLEVIPTQSRFSSSYLGKSKVK